MHFYYIFFASGFYYPEAFCRNFLYLPAWKSSLQEQGLSKYLINQALFGIWVAWHFFFSKSNTTPLVSLDNSSNLTISELFVAHYSFHPVDPKNGLKLSSLLSLCSFSDAFVVGEDEILAFYFIDSYVKFWFWDLKGMCQECDIC